MIASSPSPTLHSRSSRPSHNAQLEQYTRPRANPQSPVSGPQMSQASNKSISHSKPTQSSTTQLPKTTDASTQYSPQDGVSTTSPVIGKRKERPGSLDHVPERKEVVMEQGTTDQRSEDAISATPANLSNSSPAVSFSESVASKRPKPTAQKKVMPWLYENCDVKDLVQLIAAMIMELIRFNDEIPLQDGLLTRFHSRAPPAISVVDYLQRLALHATLSPPILLSMVFYIDRLCILYPQFTISSLTIHRYLIASATVASKGLSDSFWTNNTYARVGGVSLKELALLELEFLWRIEWRIVPKPEVLTEYYRSLVERNDGFEIKLEGDG